MTHGVKKMAGCEARVRDPAGFGYYPCSNKGKHEREGRPICGTHAKQYDAHGPQFALLWGWK